MKQGNGAACHTDCIRCITRKEKYDDEPLVFCKLKEEESYVGLLNDVQVGACSCLHTNLIYAIRFRAVKTHENPKPAYEYWTGEKQQQYHKMYAICSGNIRFAKKFTRRQDACRSLETLMEKCFNPGYFDIIECDDI